MKGVSRGVIRFKILRADETMIELALIASCAFCAYTFSTQILEWRIGP